MFREVSICFLKSEQLEISSELKKILLIGGPRLGSAGWGHTESAARPRSFFAPQLPFVVTLSLAYVLLRWLRVELSNVTLFSPHFCMRGMLACGFISGSLRL